MIKNLLFFIGLNTFLFASSQKNMQLIGQLPFSEKINDIWGYEDGAGNSYALVCSESALNIVDVTIPSAPNLLFTIQGDTSVWRDVKSFNNFAYVVNETGGGLLIVDLNDLPNSAPFQNVSQINSFDYQTAHNIFIDENGVGYLVGSNIAAQGAFMIDLNTANRFTPTFLGLYDDQYVHDAFARGDTLYTAEINNGTFSVVDVSDKQNPIVLAREETSLSFTHNIWLSNDGQYVITTDEKPGAFIDMYDVSNLNNIKLIDQYRNSPTDSVIPHNTFFVDDYIVTSYYRNGVSLVDATIKDNIVEVGSYDTSPFSSASGFEGNWGVYPYLSNGHFLVSDREEGLFIINPTYVRAAYLEGIVFDTLNNLPVSNATIEIIGSNYLKYSQFNGSYTIGAADSGFYDLRMSRVGCQTIIETNVELETGIEKILNFETNCDFSTNISNTNNTSQIQVSNNSDNNSVNISIAGEERLEQLVIFDALGNKVKAIPVQSKKALVKIQDKLAPGIYFVHFEFTGSNTTRKFLKY